jgi:Bacterial Ig domain/HYR domain
MAWSTFALGVTTVTCTATDKAGNAARSSFTVTVNDTTAPNVSITTPSNGATVAGSSVTLTATASDNVAVANVQFKVDGTNIGSAITSSPYTTTWNSTGVADGSHTLWAVAEDTSGNYATSSISVTVNNTPPVISSISSGTPGGTTATITWTTNESANSKVVYGTTSAYGSATSSASFVTSHSIGITGLLSATTYHYAVVSTDGQGNTSTSTNTAMHFSGEERQGGERRI